MKLAEMTWKEVDAFSREAVVVVPTGSLEQHGPHLPLFTDSILVTAVAEEVERRLVEEVLLVPTLWLGASSHHLSFAGSLSADFGTYLGAIADVVRSLARHGFRKFFLLNGHGGNTSPNDVALRSLKVEFPNAIFAHAGYFTFAAATVAEVLEGPIREIRHACEAETSLMLHVDAGLVRWASVRDDGLTTIPAVQSVNLHFDELTEEGSFGYATLATAEKGRAIFEAAVGGVVQELTTLAGGFVLEGLPPKV
jgi:creatinine amidohydrolase